MRATALHAPLTMEKAMTLISCLFEGVRRQVSKPVPYVQTARHQEALFVVRMGEDIERLRDLINPMGRGLTLEAYRVAVQALDLSQLNVSGLGFRITKVTAMRDVFVEATVVGRQAWKCHAAMKSDVGILVFGRSRPVRLRYRWNGKPTFSVAFYVMRTQS